MSNYETAGQGRLTPNSTVPSNTPVPRQRPGVVIFLHGVNDPGASYASVETGLCHGLNERLDRDDLRAGRYGADYWVAKAKPKFLHTEDDIAALDDPDTHLYRRKDGQAKSVLIPFYWGYRAADGEIQRDANGDPAKVRTQYQDKFGNRLDRNFGKGGGFFANATNNLREMYGKGFDMFVRHAANTQLPNSQFMGECPHRRYFVLAAERLANMISTIRSVYPSETITIMGHSQGTLITLLAQAMLADRGQRCADCVIMVASPYSLHAKVTPKGGDTLGDFLRIVETITAEPYALPTLDDLCVGQPKSGGRAGPRWSALNGHRIGIDGRSAAFPERDNRGKVYLYFSPDDATVGLAQVVGIGTFGVPDLVEGRSAMERLREKRFYQRLWTKRHRERQPVWVGTEPGRQLLRAKGEPRYASGGWSAKNIAAAEPMSEDESLWINGEALMPMHAPKMFGGEAVKGSPSTLGKDRGDDVTQNISLGKAKADFPWLPLPDAYAGMKEDAALAKFNSGAADENGQTRAVRKGSRGKSLEREMTPDEARAWMRTADSELEDNSYHSGVLRDSENHRWVTAMDVAIGQGHILDDKDWRALLTLMGDWRMEDKQLRAMRNNPKWSELGEATRKLIDACGRYYKYGEFPATSLVNLRNPPRLVSGGIFHDNRA